VGGLRRAETTALNLSDYDPETRRRVVRGKRREERIVYLENSSCCALNDWIAVLGDEFGPLSERQQHVDGFDDLMLIIL
jgi:site-specific recombinase XerD